MEPKLPKIRSVHMTNLYLSVPENLEKFLREFRQILLKSKTIIKKSHSKVKSDIHVARSTQD